MLLLTMPYFGVAVGIFGVFSENCATPYRAVVSAVISVGSSAMAGTLWLSLRM